EQFYFTWPLLLVAILSLRLSRRRLVAIVALLTVGAAVWRLVLLFTGASFGRLFLGTDTRADALLVGCTLGMLLSTDLITVTPIIQRITRVMVGCSLLLLLSLFTILPRSPTFLYYGGYTVVALAMATLILHVIVSPQGRFARVLSWEPLVKIGMIS